MGKHFVKFVAIVITSPSYRVRSPFLAEKIVKKRKAIIMEAWQTKI